MPQYDSCTNCFHPLNGNAVCPVCGHDRTKEKKYTGILPAFLVLNNRYLIGRVLGKGGFGITYNALDLASNTICAVKEYMPAEYSTRSGSTTQVVPFSDDKSRYVFNHGKEKFVEEAKTLIRLKEDPIVVDILDYFDENNTAYLVMEFLDGLDLRKMARSNGGRIDPEYMKNVFVTVASSLMEVHRKNILHRDLSPENIIVTSQGAIKLIDFGAARNFVSTQNKGMSILLKPGFAPPEQYNAKGAHGPWSDVYALCATFYNLVSGKPLIDALFRYRGEEQPSLASLGCKVTKKTSDVIEKGMELDYKKRYRDFKALLDEIDLQVPKVPQMPVRPQPNRVVSNPQSNFKGQNPMQPGHLMQNVQPNYQVQGQAQAGYHAQNVQPNYQVQGQAQPGHLMQNVQPGYEVQNQAQAGYQMQSQKPVYGVQNPVQGQQLGFGVQNPVQAGYPAQNVQLNDGRQAVQSGSGENTHQMNTNTVAQTQNPGLYVAAIVGGGVRNKVMISTKELFKIGRSVQSCQFIINGDTNISRVHCQIRLAGSEMYLTDVSSNGTFLPNGQRLERNREYKINPGFEFYLATPNHRLIVGQ